MSNVLFTHICLDGTILLFSWDADKEELNAEAHEVNFKDAAEAFCDPKRIHIYDRRHSTRSEKRFFLFGKVKDGGVLTVRFTRRDKYIRVIGAGFWREGQAHYAILNRL